MESFNSSTVYIYEEALPKPSRRTSLVQESPCCFLINIIKVFTRWKSWTYTDMPQRYSRVNNMKMMDRAELMPVFQLHLWGWKGSSWKRMNDWTAVRQHLVGFCNAKLKWKCWQRFTWIAPYQDTSNKICFTFFFKLWPRLAWQRISETFLSTDLFITETLLLQSLKCCSQF